MRNIKLFTSAVGIAVCSSLMMNTAVFARSLDPLSSYERITSTEETTESNSTDTSSNGNEISNSASSSTKDEDNENEGVVSDATTDPNNIAVNSSEDSADASTASSEDEAVAISEENSNAVKSTFEEIDVLTYMYLASQLDEADESGVAINVRYNPEGVYFDIDTLAGFATVQLPVSINIVDDNDNLLYTVSFDQGAWNCDQVADLAMTIEEGKKNTFIITPHKEQELGVDIQLSISGVKDNYRYLLSDENENQYDITTSDENGNITFTMDEFKNYTIIDANAHKYDAYEESGIMTISDDSWKNTVLLIGAGVICVCMIGGALVYSKKRRK